MSTIGVNNFWRFGISVINQLVKEVVVLQQAPAERSEATAPQAIFATCWKNALGLPRAIRVADKDNLTRRGFQPKGNDHSFGFAGMSAR